MMVLYKIFVLIFSISASVVDNLQIARNATRKGLVKDRWMHYSNKWQVQIVGDENVVRQIAENEGFSVEKEINGLSGLYRLSHVNYPRKTKYENEYLTEKLRNYSQVMWAEQIALFMRKTRDDIIPDETLTPRREPSPLLFSQPQPPSISLRDMECPRSERNARSVYEGYVDDKYFPAQWYLHDCRHTKADGPRYSINVLQAWKQYNAYGRNVVLLVVDDGLETKHVDLRENYNPEFGYDAVDEDNDPNPVHTWNRSFSHGTKCGGVAAMKVNNTVCGIGLAPKVTLGAVRLLGPNPSSDDKDSSALVFKYNKVDIVSNSWGPSDDGQTFSQLGQATRAALKKGVKKGRGGKGIVYVFAAGNGKRSQDNCACDAYVMSMYTIAVASCDYKGKVADYSERCSNVLVTTYSGNRSTKYNVVATDIGNSCTTTHNGTSAAAPQIAALVAIIFEVNPKLTWRCVKHIFAYTAEVAPIQDNYTWLRNAAGFYVSLDFGFGIATEVTKMAELARDFVPVPPMSTCVVPVLTNKSVRLTRDAAVKIEFGTQACKGQPSEINYLEHVQVVVSVAYPKRGDLQIAVRSAAGTKTQLLEPRALDRSPFGIHNWTFTTLHAWGEPAAGQWKIQFFDTTGLARNQGTVERVIVAFHGTKDPPAHYKKPRTYYKFRLLPQRPASPSAGKNLF